MLANGTKLRYKTSGDSEWIEATGLKEIPEMGDEPEKVENTDLSCKNKQYEYGIGDTGELEYKFKYENNSATSPYRVFRQAAADKEVLEWQQEYPDGTTFEFPAMVSVKLGSAGVNGVVEFTLKMAIQGDMIVTDPIL